jgi:hypothetical protein
MLRTVLKFSYQRRMLLNMDKSYSLSREELCPWCFSASGVATYITERWMLCLESLRRILIRFGLLPSRWGALELPPI